MNELQMNSALEEQQTMQGKLEDLISKMTLEQKIGQMIQTERMAISPEELRDHHIGSVLSGGGSVPGENKLQDWIDMNDAYWEASMESGEGKLAIPLLYGVDAIHGHNNVQGATIFPHNIGLGAMNDPELIARIAKVTAKEILASGVEWTFAPTLAVAQDLRWGRTYESYSQNNERVTSYAREFVEGLQGDFGRDSVIACLKHWIGDGGTTYGMDQGETSLSEEELLRTHMTPYIPALEAGALTVMVSFNSWNGHKCHGHKYLITDLLKNRLNFGGFVISDWDGIDYLSSSFKEAIKQGVNAGIDMFMVSENWKGFIHFLKELVEEGEVDPQRIDDAVSRILRVKLKYNLFEKPRPKDRYWSGHSSFGSSAHRDVAREAVRKSMVLLKNDNNVLPLKKDARILVAGKNADDVGHQSGGFTIAWQGVSDSDKYYKAFPENITSSGYHSAQVGIQPGSIKGATSIWQGIEQMAPNAELNLNGNHADPKKHDVAIVVIGEIPYAEGMGDIREDDGIIGEMAQIIQGEMKILQSYGRSIELRHLHPEDLRTVKRIADKGIPVVTVLISGRPLVTNDEMDNSRAFVAAWLPGSEGKGVAEVLFGDYNFNGTLPFSWPTKYKGPQEAEFKFQEGFGLIYSTNEGDRKTVN